MVGVAVTRRSAAAIALLAAIGCGNGATTVTDEVPQAPRVAPAPAPGFHFTDVTREAGIDIVQESGSADVDYIIESIGSGAAWFDYDGDGDEDLYLAQGATREAPHNGPPDRLLRNEGDRNGDGVPEFVDVTEEAGLGDRLWSFGVAAADYDGDGDVDLYLCNWGPNRLYRNDGNGRFTEIGAAAGVDDARWSVSAAWSDVDRDGDLDLYVTNYVEFDFARYPERGRALAAGSSACVWKGIKVYCGPRNLEPAADVFYRNDGERDGVPIFTDATREAGLAVEEPFFGLAVRFFDADDDGDDDLYVANDSVRNAFFVNQGDGTFRDGSLLAGLAYNEQGLEQAGMGIAAGDYDGDGRIDLAVSNFSHDHDTLYRNMGGELFRDVSYPSGLGATSYLELGWGLAFVDLDLDGWEDLVIARGHVYPQVDAAEVGTSFRQRNGLLRNRGDGTFESLEGRGGPGFDLVESSRALLPHDIDGDGDIDLLFTTLDGRPRLLRNDGARGHWLHVRLEGAGRNRDGIGASVRVTAAGRTQRREIRREASFAGSVPPVAWFGLGDAARVERVEVRWPSGRITTLEDVAVDQRLTVRESSSSR